MAVPGPMPGTPAAAHVSEQDLLIVEAHEPFSNVVDKVSAAITRAIDSAYTYEQLRTSVGGQRLKPLISILILSLIHI